MKQPGGALPRATRDSSAGVVTGVRPGTFALNGEVWTIAYDGLSCTLRNVLGLKYVQHLLQHPGEEFHALDLLRDQAATIPQEDPSLSETALLNEGFTAGKSSDLGAMLDPRAKQEYKRRLEDLGEELDELHRLGMKDRAAVVEAEIDSILRELARSVGRGGRDRRAGSAAERARINVTRAIRSAIQRIGDHHKPLGGLLDTSVRTGSFCRYLPRTSIKWRFSFDDPDGTELLQVKSSSAAVSAVLARPESPAAATIRSAADGPLEAGPDQTAFVGRSAERSKLRACLQRAIAGEGGMVAISGPAGIGKTRLARETGVEARGLGFSTFSGNCYDREDLVPFIPLVEILEAGLATALSPEAFRADLRDEAAELSRLMPQLRRLFPDIPAPLQVSPEQARRLLFNAVTELLARQCAARPMLLLVEDVHWADEGTLALLLHVARSMAKLPVLVIATYRDDNLDPQSRFGRALDELIRLRVPQIRLEGLSPEAVGEMIETLSGLAPPSSLVKLFYANSEGNPLYIEELFRHFAQGGLNRAALEIPDGAELDLPQNLRLVIGRRLALVSNDTARMLATAAVMGRSFTFAMLEAATRIEGGRLVELVEEAERAGLIQSKLLYPDVQFRFAHELIRKAALETASVARRQRIHANVAEAIAAVYPHALDDHAEDLAYHLWNAGAAADSGKTVHYLQVAGTRAVQSSANIEAISHFRKALQLVNSAPDSPERTQSELMLQVALSVPLLITKGFASPDVEVVYARARHLCHLIGESSQLFPVLWGRWLFHTARGEHMAARDLVEQCLRLAEKANDRVLLLAAHHGVGVTLSALAEFGTAIEHLDKTIELYDPDQDVPLAVMYGQDFGVVARSHAAIDLWYLGHHSQALARIDEALSLARKLSPITLASALVLAAWVHRLNRAADKALRLAEEALQICTEGEFVYWGAIARVIRGWGVANEAEVADGIAQMLEGLALYRATGAGVIRPALLQSVAEAYGRAHQPEEGLQLMAEAFAVVGQSQEVWWVPELHRCEGELTLLRPGDPLGNSAAQRKAEECFVKAIDLSRAQEAKPLELRAAVSLAKLWQRQGKKAEARQLLRHMRDYFDNGLDSPDLTDAAQLIDACE